MHHAISQQHPGNVSNNMRSRTTHSLSCARSTSCSVPVSTDSASKTHKVRVSWQKRPSWNELHPATTQRSCQPARSPRTRCARCHPHLHETTPGPSAEILEPTPGVKHKVRSRLGRVKQPSLQSKVRGQIVDLVGRLEPVLRLVAHQFLRRPLPTAKLILSLVGLTRHVLRLGFRTGIGGATQTE